MEIKKTTKDGVDFFVLESLTLDSEDFTELLKNVSLILHSRFNELDNEIIANVPGSNSYKIKKKLLIEEKELSSLLSKGKKLLLQEPISSAKEAWTSLSELKGFNFQ